MHPMKITTVGELIDALSEGFERDVEVMVCVYGKARPLLLSYGIEDSGAERGVVMMEMCDGPHSEPAP